MSRVLGEASIVKRNRSSRVAIRESSAGWRLEAYSKKCVAALLELHARQRFAGRPTDS